MSAPAPSRRRCLTARWCNLILANYPVADEMLAPLLPPGTELDRRDGSAWCSLVGFPFLDTRVLGVGWPGNRHFPEWTIRETRKMRTHLVSWAFPASHESHGGHDRSGSWAVGWLRQSP